MILSKANGSRLDPFVEVKINGGRAPWGRGPKSAIVTMHNGRTFVQHPEPTSILAAVHPKHAASRKGVRKAGCDEERADSRRPDWISYRLTRARAEAISNGSDPA